MFISAMFILALLVFFIILNYRSKYSYVFGMFFLSISMLLIMSPLYVAKTANYFSNSQIDYDIFLMLSRVRIPFTIIVRGFNISIVLFLVAQVLLCRVIRKYRWSVIIAMCIPVFCILVVNEPVITWRVYSIYHSSGIKAHEWLSAILYFMSFLNNSLILVYIIYPLVILALYYKEAQFRFKRRYALVLISCISLIDVYVYGIIINGYFRSINFSNTDLTKFPTSQAPQNAYILAPILALFVIFAVIALVLYYKPFFNFHTVRGKELIRGTRILNQNITSVLHTYKNAFVGISRLSRATLKNIKNDKLGSAIDCLEVMEGLSDDQLEIIDKTLWMLRSIDIRYYHVDILECINGAIEQSAIPKHIKVEVVNDEANLIIMGDKQHLTEAVKNLIFNSIKALSDVSAPFIQIKAFADKDGDFIVVEIFDNGKGIAKKEAKAIFEPFYSEKPKITGSGIGLTYVKNVIRLHYGDIEVKSKLGAHTVFKLILPALRKKSKKGVTK